MANRLINEQSPYLLQHAHNPVDWYPWSDEAFEKAGREHKPVLVSIGYAACHWCHVMERESFENAATAAFMNEHFVCIKVDREEHPGVDHLYMDAVQAISGSGGWPLNVFVTPQRVPFYGGTYFPPRPAFNRASWMQVLQRISEVWADNQSEVQTQAQQMMDYLQQASSVAMKGSSAQWDMDTCNKITATLLQHADKQYGGFGAAPKFPGTTAISFLLEHYHFTGNKEALGQALLSLDKMIAGGIYDQLGGGFARYATDTEWLVPHFEKMLYDNALLIMSLADAYSITRDVHYAHIIHETIAFAERELRNDAGGYFSALDADSEGVEGKFYTWTWNEWMEALSENDEVAAAYFGVSESGNWEETNILHMAQPPEMVAAKYGLTTAQVEERIATVKKKLWTKRASRVRPQTDDKSLLSWNALMNIALSKAGMALHHEQYIQRSEGHMQWMMQAFNTDDGLRHTWKAGVGRIAANLDDYAYLIQAMLQLASATGDNEWVLKGSKLTEDVISHFAHEEGLFFYYTSDRQKDIPVRKVDIYDGATPSANALMAHNMQLLGICMGRHLWTEQAAYMLQQMSSTVLRYPTSFGYWAVLMQRYAMGIKVVTYTGKGAMAERKKLLRYFKPRVYALTSEKEISDLPLLENKFFADKILIFVCTEDACTAPVSETEKVLSFIH